MVGDRINRWVEINRDMVENEIGIWLAMRFIIWLQMK